MATLNLKEMKWIDNNALRVIISTGLGFASRVKNLEDKEISPFEADKLYTKDSLTIYDGYIYKAKVTNQSSTFNEIYWDKIGDDITELTLDEIKAMIGLTTEELETLSKIILDSEVRLDKTYSSSKIYTDIQNAIDTAKAYTLTELGKISGASYKVVSSTSDMTDEKIIYLLNNGTNFDIYIVDNGTPTKIGDTNIDLSGYLKIDDANNIYLKKTDATSTYATKIEINDKVDKTSIKTAISTTPSDNNLLSEKYIDENIVKKSDISTTIDSTSTDTQVPSAKAVNDKISNYVHIDTENLLLHCTVSGTVFTDFVDENCTSDFRAYHIVFNSLVSGTPCMDGFGTIYTYHSPLHKKVVIYDVASNAVWELTKLSGVWGTWQQIRSRVADVPLTVIAPEDSRISYSNISYQVKNGICYVSLWNVSISEPAKNVKIYTALPHPINNAIAPILNANGDNANLGCVFVAPNIPNSLMAHFTSAGIGGFATFSYPAAES